MNVVMVISVGKIDDTAMFMRVSRDDHTLYDIHEWPDHRHRLEFDIELPCRLNIQIGGKGQNDTIVDQSGNILSDKFLKIEALAIDKIWVKKWMLESKIFQFRGENGITSSSNYFGSNGNATFDITCADPLEFWLDILALDQ